MAWVGDAVQLTAVLRHLRKHRPNWVIDFQATDGRHSVATGIVRNAFSYTDAVAASRYDREIDIKLYDVFSAWPDRPNTRVSQCLHERFGMAWDRECGSYQIRIQEQPMRAAQDYMVNLKCSARVPSFVAFHYQGDSAKERKDLMHSQADAICRHVDLHLRRFVLLLDWRNASPLADDSFVHSVGRLSHADTWGRDAQMNAAIISQCAAFVGIDSGPSKCAAATETPSLVCWTKLHPALYFDPCPHTTHLVPEDHRDMDVMRGNKTVAEFFEKNYHWRTYNAKNPDSLVDNVKRWLNEVLS